MILRSFVVVIVMLIVSSMPEVSRATCQVSSTAMLDATTSICFDCILPVTIAGIEMIPGKSDNAIVDGATSVMCVCADEECYPCFTGIGVTVSYWAPNRVAETVSDPWCFPYMGFDMSDSMNTGTLLGSSSAPATNTGGKTSGHSFAQAHWWQNEVWEEVISQLEDMMEDVTCDAGGEDTDSGYDKGWFTELDPMWNDDELQAILEPEALLFANPIAQLACIPQALSSAIIQDMPLLFWCIGGGSSYPMTGAINNPDFTEGNERVAARAIYKLIRDMLLCDNALDACGCKTFPIWWESHYRIQEIKPVRDYTCETLGRTSVIWGYAKNPPGLMDNYVWLIYRKIACCSDMECLC